MKKKTRLAVALSIAAATMFGTVGPATASQYSERQLWCSFNWEEVRIQGRTTGDTKHYLTPGGSVWYKGYKNNITSTTYTGASNVWAGLEASILVSTNVSICV
ncbi:hypothetical protein [Oerskovia sp. KBS0722]|uniref:hypothetical protein n=1 Tax=Oerskovia sp. KBS0722 TaxID=1179673 RepID=UPI00110F3554|nr:hypothetical protein [Oerskovia sp. KBS0722]QDW61380.1 hypothetical protein FFI11_001570 [Oerskovia sp. KBS0722]